MKIKELFNYFSEQRSNIKFKICFSYLNLAPCALTVFDTLQSVILMELIKI
jgi:hypothetical protein